MKEITINSVLQNKDERTDSQFWTTEIIKNAKLKYSKIGEILLRTQYGMSIDMNEEGMGYPIYRMNEIHNSLCDLEVKKFADVSAQEAADFMLGDGDVLFNRTNSYEWVGRTGIYYNTNANEQKIFASYLVRLIPDQSRILPEFLTAFLNTSFGIRNIKARARQSVNQTNVNPEEVKEIEIPLLSLDFQKEIQSNYRLAHRKIVLSKLHYREAEGMLEQYLGLTNFSDASPTTKTLSMSFAKTGRLDAEYYQPIYDELQTVLHTTETVSSICKLHDRNFEPKPDALYGYIELANVGTDGQVSGVEKIVGSDLPSRARRRIKKGQVIVSSIEGSLSSCALVDEDYDEALCSTGFYVVDSETINPETLLVLFKSMPIQLLMKQRCSGTILTAISKEEFLNMPFPQVDDEAQRQIQAKVQESFRLRKEAKLLLDKAIKAVEMAIETDEKTALFWLTSEKK